MFWGVGGKSKGALSLFKFLPVVIFSVILWREHTAPVDSVSQWGSQALWLIEGPESVEKDLFQMHSSV